MKSNSKSLRAVSAVVAAAATFVPGATRAQDSGGWSWVQLNGNECLPQDGDHRSGLSRSNYGLLNSSQQQLERRVVCPVTQPSDETDYYGSIRIDAAHLRMEQGSGGQYPVCNFRATGTGTSSLAYSPNLAYVSANGRHELGSSWTASIAGMSLTSTYLHCVMPVNSRIRGAQIQFRISASITTGTPP